ncbi:MAG: glycosyltransferase, partial [Clostridia bacterium]|nr:glycosyltransferase [Clostridia bacterium]
IINQTYTNLEIILVNDGSTDDSGAICDEYAKKDNRIKVIHKVNEGQSIARNCGLKVATGNFIGFVDSDDTIMPETYSTLREAIEGVDLAMCSHNVVYPNKTISFAKGGVTTFNKEELWQEVFGNLNNAVWNKLFKKELLKDIYFDANFAHGEDLIFNILYLKNASSGRLVDTALYNYFKRGDSITTGKFSKRKLLEVSSKDEAKRLVSEIYPPMLKTAEKYSYRARANITRNIYKAKKQVEFKAELLEYKQYMLKNYPLVKGSLKGKERLEFFLFKYLPFAYKLLAKFYN